MAPHVILCDHNIPGFGGWEALELAHRLVPDTPFILVTGSLDEETAAWARVHAAERGMSVSRMLGEFLRQRMHQAREYDAAMRRFLAKPPKKLRQAGARYPSRDELHDRAHLRR